MRASPDNDGLDPEAARVLSKVRRLMAISVLFTGLAIAAVLAVVGFRMMRGEAPRAPAERHIELPQGARVIATAVSAERIVITIEIAGRTELRVFDLQTLEPRGRLEIGPAR